ncbi:signal recognition particle-docking protein FtsY [Lactobacillaceae bacterium Melli_B4]
MGLFDIFKRRNKKEKQSAASEEAAKDSIAAETKQQVADQTISVESSESSSIANKESEINDSLTSHEDSSSADESTSASSNEPASSTIDEESSASDRTTSESPASTSSDEAVNAASDQSAETNSSDETITESSDAEEAKVSAEHAEDESSADVESVEERTSEVTGDDDNHQAADEDEEPKADAEQEVHKYEHGLAKSRSSFGQKLNQLFANFRSVDEDFFEDLEDTLIESDVGFDMAVNLTDQLREEVKLKNVKSKSEVQNVVVQKLIELYDQSGNGEKNTINFAKEGPTVILFVGVNGVGKTTTIGKMAKLYHDQGKKVLLAAADTFRAGAIQQLDVWAQRDGVDIVKRPEKSDPASVVYEAVQKAKKEQYDVLFVDTAGRLQNKVNLMNELSKMKKVLTREIPTAPNEVMLVLDATTGQNALNQAKLFKQVTDVTGITLTKLDGTARGGIVLAIRNELHIPVKYVGLGEKVGDLQPFNASDFVYGLFKGLLK